MARPKKKEDEALKHLLQMKIPQGIFEKLQKIADDEAKETGIQRSVGVIARELLSTHLTKKK